MFVVACAALRSAEIFLKRNPPLFNPAYRHFEHLRA